MMNSRQVMMVVAALALANTAYAEQNLSHRATVKPDAVIDVTNVQGFVQITAWDKNEVELGARLESDKDTLEFEASEDRVRIKVVRPKMQSHWGKDDDAELTLRVPVGARLQIQTVSADITAAGVRGDQRHETVSGDVRTQAYDKPLTVRSVSGDSTIEGNGGALELRLETVSGNHVVRNVAGNFEGGSVSGDLDLELKDIQRFKARSVSGNVTVAMAASPAGQYQAESVSGNVRLTLQPPVNAEFDVESFSGNITSCFKAQARDKSKYGPGRELRFTEGTGGASVRVKSMSGNVRVCDR